MTSLSQNLKIPMDQCLMNIIIDLVFFHSFKEVVTVFQKQIFCLVAEIPEVWCLVTGTQK